MVMAPSAVHIFPATSTFNVEKGVYPINNNGHMTNYTPAVEDGRILAKGMIRDALRAKVQDVDVDTCDVGAEDAFFVADVGEVYRQHQRWKTHLQRVKPHYAVKCNPDPVVLRLLAELGTGFDCASKGEIEQVLKMGVDPSRIIYAQPCKTKSYLRYAGQNGVKQMTFDNADELYKIKQIAPDSELFLRIITDDSGSLCRLSLKFGAPLDTTGELLKLAKQLDLDVVGVAFHVGSGASDPQAFIKAVTDARTVFDQAAEIGYTLNSLDVGGGFVGETFDEMAAVLSEALDMHFPPNVRVIGEPGRYYVSSAFTIACNVIARRVLDDAKAMLYLNDGVYGSFSCIPFDHQHPVPKVLKMGNEILPNSETGRGHLDYSIWGPSCDSIDIISSSTLFSDVIDVGDWLYFENMGAYTICSATSFNGFPSRHEILYISSEPGARALLGL